MDNALGKILEGVSLSDSAKAAIVEAWETKLQEGREDLAASLREEFAAKYNKDKGELVEAMDIMIRDSLTPQIEELVEAKKDLKMEKAKSKKKLKENANAFSVFIKKHLMNEMKEFAVDRQQMNAKLTKFEKFVNENVTTELEEFHSERIKLAEDRVNFKINANKKLVEAKKKLVSEMATASEKFIKEHLSKEMTQFKEELLEAKKKHFGMKVFEAFAAEFGSSFFNERKEINKILKVVENQQRVIEKSAKELAETKKMVMESENKVRVSQDRYARKNLMDSLCNSLSGSKRRLMEELLEKVPTNKLTENFKIYLPAVLDETRKVGTSQKVISENVNNQQSLKEVTGDKKNLISESTDSQKKVLDDVMSAFHNMEIYANNKTKMI